MRLGIRWKWMLAHLAVGAVVLLFMTVYLSSRLERYFTSRFENHWVRELDLARAYVEAHNFDKFTMPAADRLADELSAILGMRVTLIDLEGWVVGESGLPLAELPQVENHRDRPEVVAALREGFGKSRRHSATVNLDLVYLARPIGDPKRPKGVVRIAVPVSEIDEALGQIRRLIWFAGGLGLILVLLVGFVASRSMTQRLRQLAETARRFARGDFSERPQPDSNDELADLSQALSQTAADLQKSFAQLTEERDQLSAILNSMVEGVVVTDLDGRVTLCNRAFTRMFRLSGPVEGRHTRDLLRDAQLLATLERALRERRQAVETIELVTPTHAVLQAHMAMLERARGAVVVFHDVTRLQHLEKVRRDFVANVSHEIRTPVTAIKGYVETILEDGSLSREQTRRFLQTILRNTERMARLVEDLLRLARLESPETEWKLEPVDLRPILRRVTENFKTTVEANGLELTLEVPATLPKALALASEVEAVLENLLDNAVKYGARGKKIAVQVTELDREIQVTVTDYGIGIPAEDQPRIFERFYRVDRARSRALGGTGLGLAIVKHIVERHEGRVWVESELGQGARFSFTLRKAN